MMDEQKELFSTIDWLKADRETLLHHITQLMNERVKAIRRAEAAEKKAEAWMNRCQEVFGKLDDNFNEQFPQMLERAKEWAVWVARAEKAEAQLADATRFANMYARRWKSVSDKRDRLRAALLGELFSLHKWNGHTHENVMECPLCLESEWHSRIIKALRRDEQPTAIFTEGHYFAITPGDEIQVEYVRKDSRLGFVWGEDSSWFVAMTNGYSASGYLDGRLKMDELRAALKVFAEQPAESEVKE